MSNEKMSADEVLADLQHVHDLYGIDLSRTIRGVAALIAERDALKKALRDVVGVYKEPDNGRFLRWEIEFSEQLLAKYDEKS